MARNVEIKAHVENHRVTFARAAELANEGPVEILQDDTFFVCGNGRLKLRAFSSEAGELIFYRRSDQKGPKESFYILSPTKSPDSLRETLSIAYGQAGRVCKHRTLFLAGRTRIHLDCVEGLGDFVELEVVLAEGEDTKAGEAVAWDLMDKLGIRPDQLIDCAYVDLLASRK
jgi:predicted adenylyl cyclase CyaB